MDAPNNESPGLLHLLWKKLRWGLPFMAALLPIVLLSVYSFRISSGSVEDLVESGNMSGTSNVAQLVTQEFTQTVELAHAIASVPGTVEAVRNRDGVAMTTRLRAIVLAYPQIDRVFVTDADGLLWSDYPQMPGAFGRDFSGTEWHQNVSREWKPYISGVYIRSSDRAEPVVAIAMPVMEGGIASGILVFEYRTDQITRWLDNIRLGKSGNLFLIDHAGIAVAHPTLPDDLPRVYEGYRSIPQIHQAQQNVFSTSRYIDPLTDIEMIATFQPLSVGSNLWVAVAQQPADEAFAVLNRLKFSIRLAGLILTFVTLGMVIALARTTARNEKLNRELAAKNDTLRDITSFVSHQLRAPVTAMRWTIEEIIDGDFGDVSEQVKEALVSLKDVAIQNGNLINDILNVSRIDRGVIEVACEHVALKDIAERALRDYKPALEKAGLSLALKGMEQDITVVADKEKMAEAVTNAISNAIKHTKKGGLTITLRRDDAFGYIDVTDTGEGMTQEIMDKLFDRAGVSGSNTNSAASTGLGLFIARNFMQLQKGNITVASQPGKGSTFTYQIPLAVGVD